MFKFVRRKIQKMTDRNVEHFFQLKENTYYKIANIQSCKKDLNSDCKELIFITDCGHRLLGHHGVEEVFNLCAVPFFFKFKLLVDSILFKRYELYLYPDADFLVALNYEEMEHILMKYIADKVCKGCILNLPNGHMCTTRPKTELSKKYFSTALKEHPKYQVGNVLNAFVKRIDG